MCSLVPGSRLSAEIVSTAVGMVRNQVLTSREVQIQNFLEAALYAPESAAKQKPLPLDSKAFAKAVQEALLETVVALEAASVQSDGDSRG
ncbi:MAG: hypothetical protein HC902_04275 [Calothrix sp. SM1_5_4]|nr:hypothetical protein [Calothrix sp. SM1_5_4]